MTSEPKPEVVTSAAHHNADTDDEYDFKTNDGNAAVKNDNRSALLLKKKKLEAQLKGDRACSGPG